MISSCFQHTAGKWSNTQYGVWIGAFSKVTNKMWARYIHSNNYKYYRAVSLPPPTSLRKNTRRKDEQNLPKIRKTNRWIILQFAGCFIRSKIYSILRGIPKSSLLVIKGLVVLLYDYLFVISWKILPLTKGTKIQVQLEKDIFFNAVFKWNGIISCNKRETGKKRVVHVFKLILRIVLQHSCSLIFQ